LSLGAAITSLAVVPHLFCERGALAYDTTSHDASVPIRLSNQVATHLDAPVSTAHFQTGSELFDAEWVFGTYMMAAMGFAQLGLAHPEVKSENTARADRAIETLIGPAGTAFDTAQWGESALGTLDTDHGHAAYLGYVNLAIGARRALEPDARWVELNDRITAALERRMLAAPLAVIETYPGQVFPVDCAAALGSIGLHERVTGVDHHAVREHFHRSITAHYLDARGLLVQRASVTGEVRDGARGSGTMLASYFLSFGDPSLSAALWSSGKSAFYTQRVGFGAVHEYPADRVGRGDIDSGPIVFGLGLSATGFALGASRAQEDHDAFRALFATTYLFGAPRRSLEREHFATGGPLGDAILFAMLTASPTGSR
jgi:hypothetical protein